MKIVSPAFQHNESIPSKYACDGLDISPPLHFTDVPKAAKSLVLIMEDPDVPKHLKSDGMWDHWVVYNIPPVTTGFEEGKKPPGMVGENTSGKKAYSGPCPPDREHRYFFKLFALDMMLEVPDFADKAIILSEMDGHVIEQAELIGRYVKK